ncbi:MAG TPA: nitroreductase family protein, partial [Chloroflexota bacterium]|nr:nitroreductase family protein [Chloroflexota bacterium]
MELREALVGRRTVRRFLDRPVPRDTVEQLIDAARWAPSACNLQLWEFVVVDDPELRAAIASETRFIELAPVAIFATYSHEYTRENYAWVQSAAAAIQNMMLMAH